MFFLNFFLLKVFIYFFPFYKHRKIWLLYKIAGKENGSTCTVQLYSTVQYSRIFLVARSDPGVPGRFEGEGKGHHTS